MKFKIPIIKKSQQSQFYRKYHSNGLINAINVQDIKYHFNALYECISNEKILMLLTKVKKQDLLKKENFE